MYAQWANTLADFPVAPMMYRKVFILTQQIKARAFIPRGA